jgi:SAM-dependent methyltransferase
MRNTSFGQLQKLSIIDAFGRYLSERMILKNLKRLTGGTIVMLDIGCGYDARMLRKFSSLISSGVAVDVAVSEEIKSMGNMKVYERPIEEVLPNFEKDYFDVILINSVLEHLEDPLFVLKECKRILKLCGLLMINVPTWLGKYFLEKSAFVLKFSPATEMDDHKMYYDKRDLWPILVKSGFKPSSIRLRYHKFGLNLFSVCVKT